MQNAKGILKRPQKHVYIIQRNVVEKELKGLKITSCPMTDEKV